MSRLTRAKIISHMWGAGMPCTEAKFANIVFAARKAGLDNRQAFSLACIAFHASHGYLDNLSSASRGLRTATLDRKANESPMSIWAYLKHKLGGSYRYVTDEEIRNTSMNDHAGWSAWSDTQRDTAPVEIINESPPCVGVSVPMTGAN